METLGNQPSFKTVFVLPSLSAGGAERVLINLMNGLDRAKFHPVLINVISKGPLKNLVAPDISVTDLDQKGVFRALPALYKALKAEKPDLVVSTMAHMNFMVLLLQPFFPKTKFIVREAIVPSYILDRHPVFAPLIRLAYTFLYKRADAIVSPSTVIIDELKNNLHLGDQRHILLYNPVDTNSICESLKAANPQAGTPLRFVVSGRLNYQKGVDRLLDALKGFNHNASWQLSILGDGDQKSHLETLIIQNGLQNNVSMLGHIANPWPHYAAADFLLLPSRWEGMPNVALEALACGTPVISSMEAGGIAEIASFANDNAVRIARDMDEFIGFMAKATKKTTNGSLLPATFEKATIDRQFTDLVLKTLSARK